MKTNPNEIDYEQLSITIKNIINSTPKGWNNEIFHPYYLKRHSYTFDNDKSNFGYIVFTCGLFTRLYVDLKSVNYYNSNPVYSIDSMGVESLFSRYELDISKLNNIPELTFIMNDWITVHKSHKDTVAYDNYAKKNYKIDKNLIKIIKRLGKYEKRLVQCNR